jgi:Zn-dependent protease with chaperone function
MESTFDQLGDLVNKARSIAETKVEIFKLKAAHKVSLTISSIITILAIAFIAIMILLILSIGVAIFIGNRVGDVSFGFFIVGGFYLLVGLILFIFRKNLLSTPLSNLIIDKMIQ